jgi:hypothetical protein
MIYSNTHLAFELSENALHIAEIQGKEVKTLHFEEIQKSTSTSLESQVEKIIDSITFQPKYADYTLSWIDANYTLAPTSLVKSTSAETIFQQCTTIINPLSSIEQNTINEYAISVLYSIPNWVTPLFVKYFPRITIQHAFAHVLRGITVNTTEPTLFLSIYKNHIDLALFKDKHLIVANAYDYINENDILYFTSLVLQHNNCNFHSGSLHIFESKETDPSHIDSFLDKWKLVKDFASLKLESNKESLTKFQIACV